MIVKKVPVKDIQPNSYNPNRMGAEQYESLKYGIKKYGMIQPILLRNDLTIIDGFHRWKASKEVGLKEIWAVITETTEEEAKIKTISFNALRGTNDRELLGELLEELTLYFSVDDIMLETGFEYSELKDIFAMNDLDMGLFDELERETSKAKEDLEQLDKEKEENEEEVKEDKISLAAIFGVGVMPKRVGGKILQKFEEIRKYTDGDNVEILVKAIETIGRDIRDVEKYIEELKA